jgi:dTDP-4-amino-4,6-dideoxygalactose transaminase
MQPKKKYFHRKPRPHQAPPQQKSVPFFDLIRQQKTLGPQIEQAVLRVLRSGKFILSAEVEAFEKSFADYCGVTFGIGVGSGTDALIFALKSVGVQPGDQVILPSYTFVATAFAVQHLGAIPVFADVDPKTYTLDPSAVMKLINRRTKAILPVHLFGRMADMDALADIANKRKLKMVEDAAQAHGATWKYKSPGVQSDAACFSFYPTKNLGAFGDGGMVTTRDESIAKRVRILRNLGRTTHFEHVEAGWTSRLDAVHAVILAVKLRYLHVLNQNRMNAANHYRQKLAATPLVLPQEIPGCRHVYHVFAVQVPDRKRDALRAWLEKHGITTMVHYALPVHRHVFYKAARDTRCDGRLRITNRLAHESLSLPMFPEMTDEEVAYVCHMIQNFYRQGAKPVSAVPKK